MKKILTLVMISLFSLGLLSACGKKGDPRAPGSSDYPKTYPTPE